jgi:hypothetical protein
MPMTLSIGFAAGVTPTKWTRIWADRRPDVPLEVFRTEPAEQDAVLRDGRADVSLVRLPIDETGLSVIGLYNEIPVVVAAKLGVSISGLARGEVTDPLTTAEISALLQQPPAWLVTERATQHEVREEQIRVKDRDAERARKAAHIARQAAQVEGKPAKPVKAKGRTGRGY